MPASANATIGLYVGDDAGISKKPSLLTFVVSSSITLAITCATCARVIGLCGLNVPSPNPLMTPRSTKL